MFWHAVGGGLRALLYWETWAGMLVYGVLTLVPMNVVGLVAKRDMRIGCVGVLILPIFQVFASIVVLWILLPIILGLSGNAQWTFPMTVAIADPLWMLRITGLLTFLALVSGFVPVLGRMATFTNLMVGSCAIAIATKALVRASGHDALTQIDYFPGFWTFIGLLLVGAIATTIASVGVAAVSFTVSRDDAYSDSAPGPLTMAAFGILGLIPSFMYGAWLGIQLNAVVR